MKKKKTHNLFGTNKRKTANKADQYTKDYEEEYDIYEEEDYEEAYEDDGYTDSYDAEYDGEESDADEEYDPELYDDEYVEYDEDDQAYETYDDEYDDEYIEDEEAYEDTYEEYDEDDQSDDAYVAYEDDQAYDDFEGEYADDDEADQNYDAYEEYDDEEYDEYDDEDEFAQGYFGAEDESFAEGFWEKIKEWVSNMTPFDVILASTGVVLVVAAIVTFSMLFEANRIDEQIEAIVPIGTQLSEVGVIGESGLLAMADAIIMAQSQPETQEVIESIPEETQEEASTTQVSVSFVSVERDLKIRFTDALTGALITGTVFEVELTNRSSGNTMTLTDDDRDGVIYATEVKAGSFDAVVKSTQQYKFPTTPQQVTVKDKVEYVVINVQDEVKTEAQVNVAAEDTEKVEAVQQEVTLTDTVAFVESTQTLVAGTQGYTVIDKSTIPDPSQVSSLGRSTMLFDTLNVTVSKNSMTLYTGSSDTLTGTTFQNSTEGDQEYQYTSEWKSSNDSVASVENGKVTAKSAGKATITYTVTKKTITTTTKEPDTSQTEIEEVSISIEEYDALSDTEKEKCEAISNEDNQITGYLYKKTVSSTQEPEKEVTETTETASATCEVTVEDVKVSSGSLELTASASACNVKATLTVKPSKLVYTKNDGTTETITQNFPTISWSSSDTSVATVDANGVVTGVKAGTAVITGEVKGIQGTDGKDVTIKASTNITVNAVAALTVKLDQTEAKLAVSKTLTLRATVTNYQSNQGINWESSDKKVATVDVTGLVTALAPGTVKITATTIEKDITSDKAVTATCVITVTNSASTDTSSKLKDKSGNQVYVKDTNGNYREAVYADYYTAEVFYLKSDGQYAYTGWQTIGGKTYFYDKNGKPVTGTQIIQGVTYNFGSDGAILTNVNGSTFGIDVSRHNGTIDWNAVKSSGVDYVIIRCGYRGSSTGALITDQNFHTNIKGATAAGLKVGIYVFSQAINEVEAVKEASLAVSLAQGYRLTYPIFIDTEPSGGRADALDAASRTAIVNAFCQTVQSAGYQAGIYASKTWFEQKLVMSSLNGYKIWLAQYAQTPTYGGRYDMWQHSSKGKISGINGNVDLNLSYLGL